MTVKCSGCFGSGIVHGEQCVACSGRGAPESELRSLRSLASRLSADIDKRTEAADVLYGLLRKTGWCPGCDGGCAECRQLPAMPWQCGPSESALREGQEGKVPDSDASPSASPVSAAPTKETDRE